MADGVGEDASVLGATMVTGGAEPLQRMRLERTDGRPTLPVLVRWLDGDAVEVHGADGGPAPDVPGGKRAVLLRGVQGDARYATTIVFRYSTEGPHRAARRVGTRERLQQRRYVRGRPPPVDVTLDLPGDGAVAARQATGWILDLSACGLRSSHDLPMLTRGTTGEVRVDLPDRGRGGVAVDLGVEVRRVEQVGVRAVAGLMFLDVPPRVEQQLVRWVFEIEGARRREGRVG
jgi:hypothetical protein